MDATVKKKLSYMEVQFQNSNEFKPTTETKGVNKMKLLFHSN